MAVVTLSSSTSSADSEWASLPLPVVFLVLDKLPELIDLVRFTAVCKEWGSLAGDYHSTRRWYKNGVLPMLLIPTGQSDEAVLYSVSHGKVYRLNKNIQLPMSNKQRWYGCGYGWLAIVDWENRRGYACSYERTITLINPFYGKTKHVPSIISLPSLIHHNHYCMPKAQIKVFLSDDPAVNPDNYVVVALFPTVFNAAFKNVAFKKSGESKWTHIVHNDHGMLTDVIFYKDQVYLAGIGYLLSLYPESEIELKGEEILPPRIDRAYLVESVKGDLWYVGRVWAVAPQLDAHYIKTKSFIVYKLVFDGFTVKPVEVKSIGDETLFLGGNQSISILSSQFPGCQPNSIYYTDDYLNDHNHSSEPCDMGRFNLDDGTMRKYHTGNNYENMPTPVWITPVFNNALS